MKRYRQPDNHAMRLSIRRTFWLSALLIVAPCVTGGFLVLRQPSEFQAKCTRIEAGTKIHEVKAILGEPESGWEPPSGDLLESFNVYGHVWRDGPNNIDLRFSKDEVYLKKVRMATAWETLKWFVKKGAEKVGVKL